MDDELNDMFLLNDCLISGRLSPGPPDDFLVQGTRGDSLLNVVNGGHNNLDTSSFLCFDNTPALASESPRRPSLDGTISSPFIRHSATERIPKEDYSNFLAFRRDDPASFLTFKADEKMSDLSPPIGKSPDHDYLRDVKEEDEEITDSVKNGDDSYHAANICSNKRTFVGEYSHHQRETSSGNDDESGNAALRREDYFERAEDTKGWLRSPNDERIIACSNGDQDGAVIAVAASPISSGTDTTVGYRLVHVTTNGNSSIQKRTLDEDSCWSYGPISKDDDVAPLADDNSSTTSGDSCSNCGYLSPSPGPAYHRSQGVCSSPYHTKSRYRSSSQAGMGNVNLNLRNRSKMHELAVKHNLISEQDPRNKGYVILSVEERRTLIQEGLPVPTKLPLSKQEEEALKIVRRKIKNKLSAQESRRKRKEYMETLEQQIEGYQSENSSLRRRIDSLEKTNQSLLGQLKKLQHQFASSDSPASATALLAEPNQRSRDPKLPGGGTNVHHTVSLAAVFLLFAIMVPAVPVWPAVFQNAFIRNSMMAKASNGVGDSSISPIFAAHSSSSFPTAPSRILSGNSVGECDVPYSAEYFEKLNECRGNDLGTQGSLGVDPGGDAEHDHLVTDVLNDTDDSGINSDQKSGYFIIHEDHQVSAVCGTVACRDGVAVS